MAKYKRPVLVLTLTEYEGKPAYMGSARGYERSKLTDFRKFCMESGLEFVHAGHPNAFGVGIYAEDMDEFIKYSDEKLKDIEFSPNYKVDFIYQSPTLNPQDVLDIGSMKTLWGQNIDEALVALEGVHVTKEMVSLMSPDKKPTLKISLSNGVALIKFKSSEEEYKSFLTETGCVVLDLVGKCEVNRYYNSVMPQIIIEDYEIVDRQEYYF